MGCGKLKVQGEGRINSDKGRIMKPLGEQDMPTVKQQLDSWRG